MADASAQSASVTALVTAAGKLVKVETDAIRASGGAGAGAADRIERILQKLASVIARPTPVPAAQAEQELSAP